ncbi:MAG: cysteine desulfurase [Oscillospiraceae bacterium]|nr:cysteine desulfurase [Oscillospiraceae bacterium]MCL2279688.1 cysteine desulfurase [Oscillospiraceae bacterium]
MNKTIYFDNAASTAVCEEALEAMLRVMREDYGNPSSMHEQGRRALSALDRSRKNISDALGTKTKNVLFTSGGTEANNLAILGTAERLSHRGKHIITSAIEHSAVLEPIKKLEKSGFEVSYLLPDENGLITAEAFAAALRDDTVFASVMLVNNEVGTLNPIKEYSCEIKRRNLETLLHTDAVQGLCKIPFSVSSLGADLIAVSSHKLHGPKGVGALYFSDRVRLSPLLLGGSHEGGKRAGTEALPAAVGFGEAVRIGMADFSDTFTRIKELREYAARLVKSALTDTVIIGEGSSPFLLCLSLPGYKGEVLMNYLDGKGIYVSRGTACKKGARSRVLEAMKLRSEVIDGALRVSFSRYSTKSEVERFVDVLVEATNKLMKSGK